jgi:hypothetical protein
MIFNGHTHDSLAQLDEMTMAQIQVMYSDGVLGNQGVITVLGQLTAGVFNYMRAPNTPDFKLAKILSSAYDYIVPPLTPEQQKEATNNALKTYMTAAPGFRQDRFKT